MTANQPETRVDFSDKQREFADYIRNPELHTAPADVKTERMLMYRELFFNNIEGFLSSNFPVLRSLLNDRDWLQLVQDFFSGHICKSPYFSEIPEEFLSYLENERDNPGDLPFMLELAHYEWTEMALAITKEKIPAKIDASDDLLLTPLALSPLAWPLAYHFPVHRISSEFVPGHPPEQATFLIVYRDGEDEVHFLTLTPMTFRLLVNIQELPNQPGRYYLQQLAKQSGTSDASSMIEHGRQILQEMAARIIIYAP
ncbi:MAG: HvfC family RiPP maturation protein [Gammaproteobacteria bacterium]